MKRTILSSACAALVMGLCAGDAAAIGLWKAYEAALKNDPTLRAASFERLAGKENEALGLSNLLPQLSANYATSTNRADQLTKGGLFGDSLSHPQYLSKQASVSLRQPLVSLDGMARYKQGIAQSEYSEVQYAAHKHEMIVRLVGAYIEALYADEQLALSNAQRSTLDEQQKLNQRLLENGEGTKTDALETQAKLDLAEAQQLESLDNQRANRQALGALIGAEVVELDKLAPQFRVLPAPEAFTVWRELARKRNPEILSQQKAVEISQYDVDRNKAGHAPRVDLIASYGKNNSETLNTYNQDNTTRSIGVQLSIPLYQGGAVNASTRQAVAQLERAKAELQNKTDKVMLDLRRAYDVVVSSSAKIAALDRAVASGALLVQATEQSIKGGVRINLDLLNAQQQLFQAQRDLALARFNYLVYSLRMKAAAGVLGDADVREMAAYFQ